MVIKELNSFLCPYSSALLPKMAKQNSPSLIEVVKQVAEQQHSQASEIEKSKTLLFQLQVISLAWSSLIHLIFSLGEEVFL